MRAPWEVRTFWNTVNFEPISTIASIGVGLLGTIISAGGQQQAGQQQQQAENYQAQLAKQNATQIEATSQRQAVEERRKASFAMSRGRALAAASGAGATDPTVLNVEAGIAGQGEYNALSRLYTGTAEGNQQRDQAGIYRMMGEQASQAGNMNAFGTIIGGVGNAATMFAKYNSKPTNNQADYG